MKKIEPYSATLLVLAEDRRLKKGARTRLRLLSATAALLQGTYFHSLRIADICQAAGVSQGTFYLYFTDKMDITSKLLSDFTQMVYQELDGAKSKSVDPYDTIHAPTRTYVELFYQNRGLMRCLTQMTEESEAFAELFRTLSGNWNRRIAKNVQRTMSTLNADGEDSLAIAYALASMVDEYLTKLYVRQDPALAFMAEDWERVATLLSDLWYRALLLDHPGGSARAES